MTPEPTKIRPENAPPNDETKARIRPENRAGIRLELIAEGPVFITGCLHGPSGQHHPINLPPDDWAALETALAAAARYPVPAVATDLQDMVAEALRPHLRLVEDEDECWEVTVEGASGLADVAIEALISAARLPGIADEHVMFEYRLARDQVARFAERINAAEAGRDALRPVVEAARACRALCGEKTGPAFNSLAYAESLVTLGAAVDALDGTR